MSEQGTRLRVLSVLDDGHIARTIQLVVSEEGESYERASSVQDAVSSATRELVDVAFIELRAESGAALALCHHLPSLCPGIVVQAIVQPSELNRGAEALSLGATGVMVSPLTGDAVARVLSDAKAERARRRQVNLLEEKLGRERLRLKTYDRLVRFSRSAAQSDAVKAIVDGISQLCSAKGVALYASFGEEESERVLLAAVGTALDMPTSPERTELSRVVQARHGRLVPLSYGTRELGLLVVEHVESGMDQEIMGMADLAAAMLSLVDRQEHVDESVRVFPVRHFRTVAERLLTLAARHDRRASVIAISLSDDGKSTLREEATVDIADVVRNTDALCGTEDGDLLLFLPETTNTGAHACRRRIFARLGGDRRSRPKSGGARVQEVRSSRPSSLSIGVASFPHDGTTLKRLIRSARSRAQEDARSPVHALSLEALTLPETVDALIARPILDAGPRSPFPLDVAYSGLFSLVSRACRDALRGGETNVLVTLQPGLGMAAAARQVTTPRVLDIRGDTGCENLEAIVVEAEHGVWVCCGRIVGKRFRGVHAADPLLADVVGRQLLDLGGLRAG